VVVMVVLEMQRKKKCARLMARDEKEKHTHKVNKRRKSVSLGVIKQQTHPELRGAF
jgi:anti-sigma-K factor RskA